MLNKFYSPNNQHRNSSIELLRILAMLFITAHHCVLYSGVDVTTQPLSVHKVLIETFVYSGGKIGVVVFFLISAWYLPTADSIRASFRRVWLLEREVLFWSLTLLLANVLRLQRGVGAELIVRSVLPTATSLWWYVTAYAVFLLLFPFLVAGLKVLSRRRHLLLCIVCFMMWSLGEGFVPLVSLGLPGGTFMSFVYLYVLASFYKWYLRPVTVSMAWRAIGIGYGMLLAAALAGGAFYKVTGKLARLQVYLCISELKWCVLLIAFGFFSLFVRCEFHNVVINNLAAGTLAVYLVTEYPLVREWLWQEMLPVSSLLNSPYALLAIFGMAMIVMVVIFVLDFARRLLFRVTVDRHRGSLFDWGWHWFVNSKIAQWLEKSFVKTE